MTRTTIDTRAGKLWLLAIMLAAGVIWAGCGTSGPKTGPAARPPATSDRLVPGDILSVTFQDLTDRPPAFPAPIHDDGTITLPLLKEPIKAAGKTTGELEKEIHDAYVPGYYKHMTVIVIAQGQFYSVRGEVKAPNRLQFVSATSVLKAIASAGDFTDFARRRHVAVTRADGRVEYEDCIKAMQDPRLDLPVYPGDLIQVLRRYWPWQK